MRSQVQGKRVSRVRAKVLCLGTLYGLGIAGYSGLGKLYHVWV